MYADFESLLEPIKGPENDPSISSMRRVNNHTPSGWCVYSEFAYGKVENPLKLYHGEDCVKKFCNHVIGEVYGLYYTFPEKPMNPLTPKEINSYKRAKRCHICFKPFTKDNPSVRDHCHYSGNYRGAAHRNCNLRNRIPSYIPIIFHNLSGMMLIYSNRIGRLCTRRRQNECNCKKQRRLHDLFDKNSS